MAATDSKPKALSFAICYGFVGGPAHSRGLRKRLRRAGFKAAQLEGADIIIAHSAGCWLIPNTARPKLVMYIGMPLSMARPRRSWVRANLSSFKNGHPLRNINVRLKNTYYGLLQPRRNWNIVRRAKIAQPTIFPDAQTVFIANHNDPWPQAPILASFIAQQPWAFLSLMGTHDNIWEEPDLYAAIINHYARLLA